MNMGRIITMVLRMFMRRGMNSAIRRGTRGFGSPRGPAPRGRSGPKSAPRGRSGDPPSGSKN